MESSGIAYSARLFQLKQTSFSMKQSAPGIGGMTKDQNVSVSLKEFMMSIRSVTSEAVTAQSKEPPKVEDDFWGVDKTSQRIAEFVLKGAGDDPARLKAGREGMLQGFKAAEKAWGGKLPDISYQTMEKSLQMVDDKIKQTGASVVDIKS